MNHNKPAWFFFLLCMVNLDTFQPGELIVEWPRQVAETHAPSQVVRLSPDLVPPSISTFFRHYCYSCHGEDGKLRGGITNILDFKSLVDKGLIVAGDPDASMIYDMVLNKQMPPSRDLEGNLLAESKRPKPEEIRELRAWIASGAQTQSASVTPTLEEDYRCIDNDYAQLQKERSSYRYLWLGPSLKPSNKTDLINSLSLVLNSVSPRAPSPVKPIDICGTGRVFRINLRDFGWNTNPAFTNLEASNPYRLSLTRKVGQSASQRFVLRADWFAFQITRPPFYHDLLELPPTVSELESLLGIRIHSNIRLTQLLDSPPKDKSVLRVGFHGYPEDSQVAFSNRMIERHSLKNGAFWISYDFDGNEGAKDLFKHPTGPGGPNGFEHAGGELIWNLPNGLQAYLLASATGNRIDSGPPNIVWDHVKNQPVLNGISCMGCHLNGMRGAKQKVRAAWESTSKPNLILQRNQVLRLYPEQNEVNAILRKDTEKFRDAVAQTRLIDGGAANPITLLPDHYEKQVSFDQAVLELGITAAQMNSLQRILFLEDAELFNRLKAVGLTRKDFEFFFPKLERAVGLMPPAR